MNDWKKITKESLEQLSNDDQMMVVKNINEDIRYSMGLLIYNLKHDEWEDTLCLQACSCCSSNPRTREEILKEYTHYIKIDK